MTWQVGLYVAAVLIPLAAFTIELLLGRLLGRLNAVVATGAIGLSFLPAARLIILPQAFRGAVAPLGNTLIALLKNSTVAAAASVSWETSSTMKTMIEFNPNYLWEIFAVFAIGWVLSKVSGERK